jgi:hypothetical protein
MYNYGVAETLQRLLLAAGLCLTVYLYLYPFFHGCAFPTTDGSPRTALSSTVARHLSILHLQDVGSSPTTAPFRLLALADPQLEGDSSLPKPEDAFIPRLQRHLKRLREHRGEILPLVLDIGRQIVVCDLPDAAKGARKRLDLFANDYYLGHIYRTLHWWSKPTHVAVLGDLIGSQWVNEQEFNERGRRYWDRVFARGRRIEDAITVLGNQEEEKVFDFDEISWRDRIINIAGNHDIGYAGDISPARMDRFERVFGTANWDVRFQYPQASDSESVVSPSLHLIVLNSLILDTPALSDDLRRETFKYLNDLINQRLRPVEDRSSFTLLLTHVPLHKPEGVCVDGPFFDYWPDNDGGGVYKPHGLREQNHLSEHTSRQGTLQALFGKSGNLDAPAQGKGRHGLIMTGHDHEGCDTWHFVPSESVWSASDLQDQEEKETVWNVSRWPDANQSASHTGVREITLRSMMGDYGGNAGLLSAWYDDQEGSWKYDVQMCGLNLKVWWAVHIIDLVLLALLSLSFLSPWYLPKRTVAKTSQRVKKEKSEPT